MTLKNNILVLILTGLLASCYSFKGITVPPGVETFYVENFTVSAFNAPANVELEFTEALRKKMREEARLVFDDQDPHVSFSGSITAFDIGIAAASEGDEVTLNRLNVRVMVKYEDSVEPDNNFEKTFTEFEDFPADDDFQSLQEQLVQTIFDDIIEKLFNDTYTNW